jgi:Skp family chaperone for outer membrane proteins
MKRFSLLTLTLLLGALVAQAQTPPAAGAAAQTATPKPGTGVVVIDFNSALFDSEPGKAAVKEIDKGLDEVKTKLEKLQKELADLQTKLQNAKTDAEKAPITRDMDSKTTEGKRLSEDGQRTSDDLQQKWLPPVADLVKRMVDEYAKENNIALVLDPTTDGTNIVFAAKTSDITNEIVRRVNAAYAKDPKVVAPGTGAPANPPKPAN